LIYHQQGGFFIPEKSVKQLNLPFKIDKQFENWQFELDALEDRMSGYHSYSYIGKKLNYFLNFTTHKTELIFNGDYLTGVIIAIKHSNTNQLAIINQFLVLHASKEVIIDEYTRKFKGCRIMYYTSFKTKKKEILIIYGKPRFIQRHLLSLINN
jgi:hypothetical protein